MTDITLEALENDKLFLETVDAMFIDAVQKEIDEYITNECEVILHGTGNSAPVGILTK